MGSTWSGPREAPCFDVVATPLDNGKTRAEKIQILSPGVSNET